MCMQAAAPVWRSSASLGPRPRSRLKESRQEAMQEACRASAHVRLRVAVSKKRHGSYAVARVRQLPAALALPSSSRHACCRTASAAHVMRWLHEAGSGVGA